MSSPAHTARLPAPTYSARILFNVLSRLEKGRLTVITPEGTRGVFTGPGKGPTADIEIRDWKAVGRIVREHGGFINVESAEGEGTTFTLEFPAATRRVKLLEGKQGKSAEAG